MHELHELVEIIEVTSSDPAKDERAIRTIR
jgi:hypothetical protein